jgi:hypothetical protein
MVPPEGLRDYMPDDPAPKKGVFPSQVNRHVANTVEELARKLEVDPANFAATVKRYNELVAAGKDDDFSKPAQFLAPLAKPPFYGIHGRVRLSAITSGVLVDERHRALDASGKPIPGLYLVGNLGGGFYGGVDYPLTVFGLSLGRCRWWPIRRSTRARCRRVSRCANWPPPGAVAVRCNWRWPGCWRSLGRWRYRSRPTPSACARTGRRARCGWTRPS